MPNKLTRTRQGPNPLQGHASPLNTLKSETLKPNRPAGPAGPQLPHLLFASTISTAWILHADMPWSHRSTATPVASILLSPKPRHSSFTHYHHHP